MANLFENTSLWGHVKVSICYANLENIVMQFHIMLNSESISRGVGTYNGKTPILISISAFY